MDTPQISLALRVARGVSVLMAVAAMVAFVVLEHRRLNRTGPMTTTTDEFPAEDLAGMPVMDIEIEPIATEETEAESDVSFEFSAVPVRMELPVVNFDLPTALEMLPPPDLIAPRSLDTVVIGSESDVYMMSSKSIVVVPKTKAPKRPTVKP